MDPKNKKNGPNNGVQNGVKIASRGNKERSAKSRHASRRGVVVIVIVVIVAAGARREAREVPKRVQEGSKSAPGGPT